MRIGIEAQRLFRHKKHGMDIVALELIRALQKLDTENQYFIFVKEDEDDLCVHETPNFKIITTGKSLYPWWEQIQLPRLAKKYKLDLLHCTSNTAPIQNSTPLILTVHDIIYLEQLQLLKGSAYQIFGNLYRRWNVPRVINRAKAVITVSNFEKENIKNKFSRLPALTTIYNGISDTFKHITDTQFLSTIKNRHQLPDDFIFFLGNTDPKKNLIGVLKAFSILLTRPQVPIPKLVMPDINRSFLNREINKINPALQDHIITAGYIPNHDLPAIYTLAKVFLYPSLRESFGIPLLEAMACGVPVVTSNTSSMPEIAKNAALFVDPTKPEDIANAIDNLLNDQVLRATLTFNGFKRTNQFSWTKNATQTLDVYKDVFFKSNAT